MPIEVDTTRAPEFLRYVYVGAYPSIEEQSLMREKLIGLGFLSATTVAIMDVRQLEGMPDDDFLAKTVAAALQRGGWPRRRAYLIDPARHAHMIGQFQDLAMRTVTTASFADEEEAMDWLFSR